MGYNTTSYIDTIQLRDAVFFEDTGYAIEQAAYQNNRPLLGSEWMFNYTGEGSGMKHGKLNKQTTIYGGKLYKTPKQFVEQYGFHLQIKCSPSLMRQQNSQHKVFSPIKCNIIITIPSLLEIYKTDEWDKFVVGRGSKNYYENVSEYISYHIDMKKLKIMQWQNWTNNDIREMLKQKVWPHDHSHYLTAEDMELAQVDFCVNTIDSDVSTFYALLKHAGNYGSKNMKLYHNNTDLFDAEYTIGNYKDRDALVVKTAGSISTKANGLEFRRGSKSTQVVKFYDYTRKARKYQYENSLPIYTTLKKKDKINHLQKYYGKSLKDIEAKQSTMRYEVSIRNIIGGNKGVYKLYKKYFPGIEERTITLQHLFDKRYSKVVGLVMRKYLYDIFGDVIIEDKIEMGAKHMNKFDVIKEEGFSKGLQIMAILQLMDGDNGLSMQELKKKFVEIGVGYESVRRITNMIKSKGYASNWNTDRIVAMNVIKELYEELDKVK